MTKYHEKRICFFDKRFRSLCHASLTLKFRLRWFAEEEGYLAKKGYTDINLPLLISNEVKNISGSLILELKNDDVTCKPRIIFSENTDNQ